VLHRLSETAEVAVQKTKKPKVVAKRSKADRYASILSSSSRPAREPVRPDVDGRGGSGRRPKKREPSPEVQPTGRLPARIVPPGVHGSSGDKKVRPEMRIPTRLPGGKRYARTARAAKAAGQFVFPPGRRETLYQPAPLGSRAVDPNHVDLDDPIRHHPDGEVTVWFNTEILKQHPSGARWFMPSKDKNKLAHAISGNTMVARWGKS
jgi:hypothetical protein